MAKMVLRCKGCKSEATLDPVAVMEGASVVLKDCRCHHLSRLVATMQEAAILATVQILEGQGTDKTC